MVDKSDGELGIIAVQKLHVNFWTYQKPMKERFFILISFINVLSDCFPSFNTDFTFSFYTLTLALSWVWRMKIDWDVSPAGIANSANNTFLRCDSRPQLPTQIVDLFHLLYAIIRKSWKKLGLQITIYFNHLLFDCTKCLKYLLLTIFRKTIFFPRIKNQNGDDWKIDRVPNSFGSVFGEYAQSL